SKSDCSDDEKRTMAFWKTTDNLTQSPDAAGIQTADMHDEIHGRKICGTSVHINCIDSRQTRKLFGISAGMTVAAAVGDDSPHWLFLSFMLKAARQTLPPVNIRKIVQAAKPAITLFSTAEKALPSLRMHIDVHAKNMLITVKINTPAKGKNFLIIIITPFIYIVERAVKAFYQLNVK